MNATVFIVQWNSIISKLAGLRSAIGRAPDS